MRAGSKRHDTYVRREKRLCLLADPPETAERVQDYFERVDDYDVLIVPEGPLPEADWSVVPADRLPDLEEARPRLVQRTRLIAFGSAELLTPAFLFGCWDFLKDPWSPEELYLRLRRVADPESTPDRSIAGTLEFDAEMIWSSRHAVDLRPAEYRLLEVLVHRAGEIVSREELNVALSHSLAEHSRSLDMNISNLRRKLRIVTAPESPPRIEVERGRGYRLVGWEGATSPSNVK